MLRYDLLESGYHFKTIEPKKSLINMIWAGFALIFAAAAALIYFSVITGQIEKTRLPLFYIDVHIYMLNIIFIGTPIIYFVSKELLTAAFSSHKKEKIEMKLHSDTGMAVTAGREAFRTWQIIRIYLIPLCFVYPLLIILGVLSGGNMSLLILTFIMSFYMSFDLTLVIYVLYLKMRYNADYVGIKNHVYMLTLYSERYIEQREYTELLKNKLIKIIRAPAMKIVCGFVICVFLASVMTYNFALRTPDSISEHSYSITDAVRISAYLLDRNDENTDASFELERLNLNEVRFMAPMVKMETEGLGLYLKIDNTSEIVNRVDILSENGDMLLSSENIRTPDYICRCEPYEFRGRTTESYIRLPPGGEANLFPVSFMPDSEFYLTIYAYRNHDSAFPRITARLRLAVSEDTAITDTGFFGFPYMVSIEMLSYEISELDMIVYDIDE